MENRIEVIRNYMESIFFSSIDNKKYRFSYMSHMVAASQFCALIALKRGENAELATIAGLLHDIYAYKNVDSSGHAEKGVVLAREILNELKLTSDEETDLICSAIHNHSSKEGSFSTFDEVLIDADVMQHCLYNITKPEEENEKIRFNKLIKEFSLSQANKLS